MDDFETADILIGYLRSIGISAYHGETDEIRIYEDMLLGANIGYREFKIKNGNLLPIGPRCVINRSEICLASGDKNIKKLIDQCLACESDSPTDRRRCR